MLKDIVAFYEGPNFVVDISLYVPLLFRLTHLYEPALWLCCLLISRPLPFATARLTVFLASFMHSVLVMSEPLVLGFHSDIVLELLVD